MQIIFSLIELAFAQSKLAAEQVAPIPMHKQINMALFIEYIVDSLPIQEPSLNVHIWYVWRLDYFHLFLPLLLGVQL
jgi:hypothetical protein